MIPLVCDHPVPMPTLFAAVAEGRRGGVAHVASSLRVHRYIVTGAAAATLRRHETEVLQHACFHMSIAHWHTRVYTLNVSRGH